MELLFRTMEAELGRNSDRALAIVSLLPLMEGEAERLEAQLQGGEGWPLYLKEHSLYRFIF